MRRLRPVDQRDDGGEHHRRQQRDAERARRWHGALAGCRDPGGDGAAAPPAQREEAPAARHREHDRPRGRREPVGRRPPRGGAVAEHEAGELPRLVHRLAWPRLDQRLLVELAPGPQQRDDPQPVQERHRVPDGEHGPQAPPVGAATQEQQERRQGDHDVRRLVVQDAEGRGADHQQRARPGAPLREREQAGDGCDGAGDGHLDVDRAERELPVPGREEREQDRAGEAHRRAQPEEPQEGQERDRLGAERQRVQQVVPRERIGVDQVGQRVRGDGEGTDRLRGEHRPVGRRPEHRADLVEADLHAPLLDEPDVVDAEREVRDGRDGGHEHPRQRPPRDRAPVRGAPRRPPRTGRGARPLDVVRCVRSGVDHGAVLVRALLLVHLHTISLAATGGAPS